jgi:hypothetical protein
MKMQFKLASWGSYKLKDSEFLLDLESIETRFLPVAIPWGGSITCVSTYFCAGCF